MVCSEVVEPNLVKLESRLTLILPPIVSILWIYLYLKLFLHSKIYPYLKINLYLNIYVQKHSLPDSMHVFNFGDLKAMMSHSDVLPQTDIFVIERSSKNEFKIIMNGDHSALLFTRMSKAKLVVSDSGLIDFQ